MVNSQIWLFVLIICEAGDYEVDYQESFLYNNSCLWWLEMCLKKLIMK